VFEKKMTEHRRSAQAAPTTTRHAQDAISALKSTTTKSNLLYRLHKQTMPTMKFNSDRYDLQAVLSKAPDFGDVPSKLDAAPHACYAAQGSLLTKVLPRRLYEAPMLVVRSKRMTESWRPYLYNERPRFTLDRLAARNIPEPFWTWDGPGLSLSFNTLDYAGLLCDAIEARKPMLVAWVVGDTVTVDQVPINQKYLNMMSTGITKKMLPQFVPPEFVTGEEVAQIPSELFADEHRYILEGERSAYIVKLVGVAPGVRL
jgi:hypothetical protein